MISWNNITNEECVAKTDRAPARLPGLAVLRDSGDDSQSTFNGIRPADLFNQQVWCWGRDIECSQGNLLVRYGFRRSEKTTGESETSLYELNVSPNARVVLRGFGVFYGDDRWGGLFLRRYGFSPQLTPSAKLSRPIWSDEDLPPLTDPSDGDIPRSQRLLLALIDWIRHYEVWIVQTMGIEYRRETLVPWNSKKRFVTPAVEMASAWRLLGVVIANSPEAATRPCNTTGILRDV